MKFAGAVIAATALLSCSDPYSDARHANIAARESAEAAEQKVLNDELGVIASGSGNALTNACSRIIDQNKIAALSEPLRRRCALAVIEYGRAQLATDPTSAWGSTEVAEKFLAGTDEARALRAESAESAFIGEMRDSLKASALALDNGDPKAALDAAARARAKASLILAAKENKEAATALTKTEKLAEKSRALTEKQEKARIAEEKETARLHAIIGDPPSRLDGVGVTEVQIFLPKVLNDPESLKFVDWSPDSITTYKGAPAYAVTATYRARNGFGGYVLSKTKFFLRNDQVVGFTNLE